VTAVLADLDVRYQLFGQGLGSEVTTLWRYRSSIIIIKSTTMKIIVCFDGILADKSRFTDAQSAECRPSENATGAIWIS